MSSKSCVEASGAKTFEWFVAPCLTLADTIVERQRKVVFSTIIALVTAMLISYILIMLPQAIRYPKGQSYNVTMVMVGLQAVTVINYVILRWKKACPSLMVGFYVLCCFALLVMAASLYNGTQEISLFATLLLLVSIQARLDKIVLAAIFVIGVLSMILECVFLYDEEGFGFYLKSSHPTSGFWSYPNRLSPMFFGILSVGVMWNMANALVKQQAQFGNALGLTKEFVHAISAYDVDVANEVLQNYQTERDVDSELLAMLASMLSNLQTYRQYLPVTLFSVQQNSTATSGDSGEPQSPLVSFVPVEGNEEVEDQGPATSQEDTSDLHIATVVVISLQQKNNQKPSDVNEVMSFIADCIERYHGVVDFGSNTLMQSTFNAYTRVRNHWEAATLAALEIDESLATADLPFDFTIGVSSGLISIQSLDTEKQCWRVSMGEPIELLERLLSLQHQLPTRLLLTEDVIMHLTLESLPVEHISPFWIPNGYKSSIMLYEVTINEPSLRGGDLQNDVRAVFSFMRKGNYADALHCLQKVPREWQHWRRIEYQCLTGSTGVPHTLPEPGWLNIADRDTSMTYGARTVIDRIARKIMYRLSGDSTRLNLPSASSPDSSQLNFLSPNRRWQQKSLQKQEAIFSNVLSSMEQDVALPSELRDLSGTTWRRALDPHRQKAPAPLQVLINVRGDHVSARFVDVTSANIKSGPSIEELAEEVEAMSSQLQHYNVVSILSQVKLGSHFFIIEEHASGGSLAKLQQAFRGQLPLRLVKRIALDVLRGLVYLHSNDIVHCDIKPANILSGSDGFYKLANYGEALHPVCKPADKITDDVAASRSEQQPEDNEESIGSQSIVVRGTPLYMAPEACLNDLRPESDVWSFGVTFLELIMNRNPWRGHPLWSENETEFLVNLSNNPDMVPKFGFQDSSLENLLRQCLTWQWRERPNPEELLSSSFFV